MHTQFCLPSFLFTCNLTQTSRSKVRLTVYSHRKQGASYCVLTPEARCVLLCTHTRSKVHLTVYSHPKQGASYCVLTPEARCILLCTHNGSKVRLTVYSHPKQGASYCVLTPEARCILLCTHTGSKVHLTVYSHRKQGASYCVLTPEARCILLCTHTGSKVHLTVYSHRKQGASSCVLTPEARCVLLCTHTGSKVRLTVYSHRKRNRQSDLVHQANLSILCSCPPYSCRRPGDLCPVTRTPRREKKEWRNFQSIYSFFFFQHKSDGLIVVSLSCSRWSVFSIVTSSFNTVSISKSLFLLCFRHCYKQLQYVSYSTAGFYSLFSP